MPYKSRKQKEASKLVEKVTKTAKDREDPSKVLEKKINPFTRPDDLNEVEVAKMVLGIVVVPIKVVLIFITLSISWLFAKLSIYYKEDHRIRQFFLNPVAFFSRVVLFIMGVYHVEQVGTPCSTEEATIVVVAPHSTLLDSAYIFYALGHPSVVSKIENKQSNFMGTFAIAGDTIFVDRESKSGKSKALEQIEERSVPGPNLRHLVIFPEGTCTNRKTLIGFKRGAFAPGQPVQPVLLKFNGNSFDPSWTAGTNRMLLAYRLFCQFHIKVEVEFMRVYHPSVAEKEDSVLFANNVRQAMADRLNVPVTDHSYEDMFLAKLAYKEKFHFGTEYDFKQLHKLYNISLDDAKRYLRRFTKGKHFNEKGEINVKGFAQILGVPVTKPLVHEFDLLDQNGDGKINFYEFIAGMAMLSENASSEDTIRLVFDMFDPEGKGTIEFSELMSVVHAVCKTNDAFMDQLKSYFKIKSKEERKQRKKGEKIKLKPSLPKRSITYDEFSGFVKEYPEYLHLALEVSALARNSRKLSILQESDWRKSIRVKSSRSKKNE